MDIEFFIFNEPLKPQTEMFIQVSQNLFGIWLTADSPGISATKGNLTPNSLYFVGKHLETQLQE